MKFIRNEKGIALVTALMLTMITLVISMVMLYLVIQNTQLAGAQKRYRNALDAATGGVDVMTMDALPYLVGFAADPAATALSTSASTYFTSNLTTVMPNLMSAQLGVSDKCMQEKLISRNWPDCPATSSTVTAKNNPDVTFVLQSQLAGAPAGFKVYSKIVSTTPGASDMSGRDLEGGSTTQAPSQDVGAPYLYRIEVSSEKASNPNERANLSVLYAY